MKTVWTKSKATLAPALLVGGLLLGAAAPSVAEEMTGNLWNQIHSTTGSTFTGADGVTHQVWQRHSVTTDDARKFVGFYSDVISYRIERGILAYETHGTYTFPDDNTEDDVTHQVFLHTAGRVNLQNGEWTWDLTEVTGGTGRFANVKAEPRGPRPNDFGGPTGGCLNPPGDPQGFPNIVLCQAVVNWTY